MLSLASLLFFLVSRQQIELGRMVVLDKRTRTFPVSRHAELPNKAFLLLKLIRKLPSSSMRQITA
jgi:hypothetical protein